MQIRRRWLLTLTYLLCFYSVGIAHMQDQTVVVPNLAGLNIPQAVAALNKIGLALGNQTSEPWTQTASVPQNTISSQSIPPGQTVTVATSVDVTVLRSPNVSMSYDDNDFTLINNTGSSIDFNSL